MISIAMTTYNGECYIQEQLDSIIAQRMANWELVICDDCSSDNTWLILQEYSQKDGRVKIIPIPDEYQFHDWWIAVVAAMNGGAYYIDEKIVNYRIHSKSITNSNNRNCFSALKNKLKNSRAYYRDILNVHNYLNCIELDESQKMYKRKAEKIISCFSTWKQRFLCLHEYIQNWQLICFDSNSLKFPFYFAKKILLCC